MFIACGILFIALLNVSVDFLLTLLAEIALVSEILEYVGDCGTCLLLVECCLLHC